MQCHTSTVSLSVCLPAQISDNFLSLQILANSWYLTLLVSTNVVRTFSKSDWIPVAGAYFLLFTIGRRPSADFISNRMENTQYHKLSKKQPYISKLTSKISRVCRCRMRVNCPSRKANSTFDEVSVELHFPKKLTNVEIGPHTTSTTK